MTQTRYLWGICSMCNYEPENEELFYKLDCDNIKTLFEETKKLWKEDKKNFIKRYKYITELEMFINWKGHYYRELGDYDKANKFGIIWEKMHDYNCNKFNYNTEEGKYYFRTID